MTLFAVLGTAIVLSPICFLPICALLRNSHLSLPQTLYSFRQLRHLRPGPHQSIRICEEMVRDQEARRLAMILRGDLGSVWRTRCTRMGYWAIVALLCLTPNLPWSSNYTGPRIQEQSLGCSQYRPSVPTVHYGPPRCEAHEEAHCSSGKASLLRKKFQSRNNQVGEEDVMCRKVQVTSVLI